MSSVGGSDITSVIRQIIEAAFLNAEISSSGGDSPKINRVLNTDINVQDFNSIFEGEIRRIVEDITAQKESGDDITVAGGDKEGITEGQVVGVASRGLSGLNNPGAFVGMGLGLLPHAVLVSFVISLMPMIFEEMTRAGGPWDLTFRRIVEKEYNSLQNRQAFYDLTIGERGLIIQSRGGLLNRNTGSVNTNTLRMIREGGIDKNIMAQLDYTDHAKGLF